MTNVFKSAINFWKQQHMNMVVHYYKSKQIIPLAFKVSKRGNNKASFFR